MAGEPPTRAAIFQRDAIGHLLGSDEFLMLILDACRWDTLTYYLDESVGMTVTPAPLTVRWLRCCWPGQYDITYVAANPQIAPVEMNVDVQYNGENHFEELVYLGDEAWDDDLGTVPPAPLVDATIETDANRMITHFLQPHVPFIGENSLGNLEYGTHGYEVLEGFSQEEISAAYLGNLDRAWTEGVVPLLDEYQNRRVVVTADHGEMLGENDKYGHGVYSPPVLIVPWVEYPPGATAGEGEELEVKWAADVASVVTVLKEVTGPVEPADPA